MQGFKFNDEVKSTSVKRFDDLRKEIQLQLSSAFNEKNIKTAECNELLVNLIYLLNQGEKFTEQEKETLFFNVTKLLHSANTPLRRTTFLFVKHLDFWKNSFILTGSLMSEINKSTEHLLKPNCFRLLGQIIDNSSVSAVERLLKVAISNQTPEIASSAVICSLFMAFKGINVAKAWISEISEKLTSSMGQENLLMFHTLLLLKQIKSNDKLFLIKIYLKIAQSQNTKSQFAICQLIRLMSDMMKKDQLDTQTLNQFNAFFEKCLYKSEESIKIEACRAILESSNSKEQLQRAAFTAVCELLNSNSRVTRFSCLKTLDKYMSKFSSSIAIDLFLELEKIIEDSNINSSIKAIALSIFLKISKGLSDFRLEKMFKSFIEQYPKFKDDFKREVVLISKGISRENVQKNKLFYNFFCSLIHLDSNSSTKLELLDALIWFIYNDKSLKDQTIFFLSDYMSDCKYDVVKIRILSLIGKECMTTMSLGRFVRNIFNQIILENPMVRSSAIAALGEIAFKQESLRKTIISLIKRSFGDSENEVRERAFFYYKALSNLDNEEEKNSNIVNYLFNPHSKEVINIDVLQAVLKIEKDSLFRSTKIAQELALTLSNPEKVSQILSKSKTYDLKESKKEVKTAKPASSQEKEAAASDEYEKTMFYKKHKAPIMSSKFLSLTEDKNADYLIKFRKIIYDKLVILDLEITNTIELQVINNVSLKIDDHTNKGFDFDNLEIIKNEKIETNETGHLFIAIPKVKDYIYSSCSFPVVLEFDLQELDVKGKPHGIPIRQTYPVGKSIEITYADYCVPNLKVTQSNYKDIWKKLDSANFTSLQDKIILQSSNMKMAGRDFSKAIGLMPVNDIDKIEPTTKQYEFCYAYQNYLEMMLFVKLQVIFKEASDKDGKAQLVCGANIIIMSQDEDLANIIHGMIFN